MNLVKLVVDENAEENVDGYRSQNYVYENIAHLDTPLSLKIVIPVTQAQRILIYAYTTNKQLKFKYASIVHSL